MAYMINKKDGNTWLIEKVDNAGWNRLGFKWTAFCRETGERGYYKTLADAKIDVKLNK